MENDGLRVRHALGMLLAGMLLVLLDLGINGFDLLPDPAGWLLAAVALGRLRDTDPDDMFRGRATAAWVLAWIAATLSTVAFVAALPTPIDVVDSLVSSVQPVFSAFALLRFAELRVPDLRRTWETSVAALVATFLLTHGVILLAATTHTDDIHALAVLAVVVFLAAFAHYLISIHRTRFALAR